MSAFLDAHNFLGAKLAWQQAILSDHSLTDAAKLVGCQLMHDLHSQRRCAWRSQDQISALLGKDRRTIQRALAQLVKAGHLEQSTSRGRGHANTYRALIRSDDNEPPEVTDHAEVSAQCAAPVSRTVAEKAAPVSHSTPQKAAPVSHSTGEKAALVSIKGGTGAAPYLDKPINTPLPPKRAVRPAGATFPDTILRATAVQRLGEGWAASYLDAAVWHPETRTIVCKHQFAVDRISEALRAIIRASGVTVVSDRQWHQGHATYQAAA